MVLIPMGIFSLPSMQDRATTVQVVSKTIRHVDGALHTVSVYVVGKVLATDLLVDMYIPFEVYDNIVVGDQMEYVVDADRLPDYPFILFWIAVFCIVVTIIWAVIVFFYLIN